MCRTKTYLKSSCALPIDILKVVSLGIVHIARYLITICPHYYRFEVVDRKYLILNREVLCSLRRVVYQPSY